MLSFINNIKIKTPEDEKLRGLYPVEVEKIKKKFYRKTKLTFEFQELIEELGFDLKNVIYYKEKEAKEFPYQVNYRLNTTVQGCPTISNFIALFGKDWKNILYLTGRSNKKDNAIKYGYEDIWHIWQTYKDAKSIKEFAIKVLQFDEKKADKFSKVSIKSGYCDLSLSAINKINIYLEKGLINSHAVFMANLHNVIKKEIWEEVESRKTIENEIGEIIKEYSLEKQYKVGVNDLLSKYYNDDKHKVYYSKEAESIFRKDLWKKFEDVFGKNTWNENKEKEVDFENYLSEFIVNLKDRKRVLIPNLEKKISDFLIEQRYADEDTIKKMYHPSANQKFKTLFLKDREGKNLFDENGKELFGLGSPLTTSIKNPMAMKTIFKLRKLINELLIEHKIDDRTIIHIETARELNDNNKRKAIEEYQKEREDLRNIYREKIKELYKKETGIDDFIPNDDDVMKFQFALEQREDTKIVTKDELIKYTLWKEQNHVCLYTGKTISLSDFLGKTPKYDIEHTLPRRLSQDNSLENKTLTDIDFNRNIKKRQMPTQLDKSDYLNVLPRISHWKKRYILLDNEIQALKKKASKITDKDFKDKNIQQRHKLKMEYDYWFGKHNRFVMTEIKDGFKNSQLVDTGIITSFAINYLKSKFKSVYAVKGTMTDEFRKLWAKDVFYIETDGKLEKNRNNHTHHCKDAVVIACITKDKYDFIAKYWEKEDENKKEEAKEIIRNTIPWKGFAADLKAIEETVLVKHVRKDVMKVATFKKLRKRGKLLHLPEYKKNEKEEILLDEKGKKIKVTTKHPKTGKVIIVYQKDNYGKPLPIIQRSDSSRGSLHKQSFISAIAKPIQDENNKPLQLNGKFILQKDENGNVQKFYVIRKELTKLNKIDIEKIVDNNIKEIIKKAELNGSLKFKKEGATIEKIIWQNEEKKIPIYKVRISVKDTPLEIKQQPTQNLLSEKANRKLHKHSVYAQNDENYCMAIYEGIDKKGKTDRKNILINNFNGSKYLKKTNKDDNKENKYNIVPEKFENGYFMKYILTKGKMVLMYDKKPEELYDLSDVEKLKFLYEITQLDVEGNCIKLLHHTEARSQKTLSEFMNLASKMKGGKNYGNYKKYPWIKLVLNDFDCLVEGYEFNILPTGKIIFL